MVDARPVRPAHISLLPAEHEPLHLQRYEPHISLPLLVWLGTVSPGRYKRSGQILRIVCHGGDVSSRDKTNTFAVLES